MTPTCRRMVVFATLLALAGGTAFAQTASVPAASDLRAQLARLSPFQQDEVLWLARCMYSESDRAHEQRLVAWVVRNRAETDFRGTTYREVVLEPKQFSAFNKPSRRRTHILNLDAYSLSRAWRRTLGLALEVYHAPASERPFPITTRHFYSPISMQGGRTPHWAKNETPLSAEHLGIDPYRFRFFAGIDEGLDEGRVAGSGLPAQVVRAANAPEAQPAAPQRTLRRMPIRSRLRSRRLSGRVKRPVRPHLDRRGRQ